MQENIRWTTHIKHLNSILENKGVSTLNKEETKKIDDECERQFRLYMDDPTKSYDIGKQLPLSIAKMACEMRNLPFHDIPENESE